MRLARIYRERSLPIKLYSRDVALIFHTCTATLFCVASVMTMAVAGPSWESLRGFIFFGLCLAIFIHQHHLGSPYLRLDYGGFTRGLGKSQQKVAWVVVDKFFVGDYQGRKVVAWRYLPNTPQYRQLSFGRGCVRGVHGSLYYTYGKNPEHLVDLMNELCRAHRMTAQYLAQSHHA